MELSEDIPVTLVIKAPNQRLADQTVDCMLGWTIKKLKQHLETVYPSKPKHNEQRLIYSGRLLQDHLTLKEILRQYDSEIPNKHTVHLVCSTAVDSSSSSTPLFSGSCYEDLGSQVPAPLDSGNPSGMSDQVNSDSINTGHAEGLRYRGHGQLNIDRRHTSAYSVHQTVEEDISATHIGHPYSAQQYAWMMQQQQIYTQYMMNYMQYFHSIYSPAQSFSYLAHHSQFIQQSATANSALQQQPPPAAEAAAQNNIAAGAGQPNVRMNAQGGMEDDDEEGEPRDWLHHAYFFMRFLMFMAILFFYSNLTRFVVVFSGFFVIYILQKFRNYLQRSREQEHQQQDQHSGQQQQQQQHEQGEQEQQQEQQQEQPDVGKSEVPAHEPAVQNGEQHDVEAGFGRTRRVFVFICNTVQTFFTSLLPTPPELIQQN